MQIKKLKLTNAFQHGSLEVDFAPFQAIVGANGSGKSNLLEAIGYTLTGQFTLPGKQESMVKEGEEKGKVELTVESEGDMIELVAHLGKSNRTLHRNSKPTGIKLSKASEVLEYLENYVLRTPPAIVNTSSIVRQGALCSGLFDTQAKRTDAFIRMAGLSDIEKKRQLLSDAKAQVTVPMLSFTVAETEKKVQELKDYLAKIWAEMSAVPVTDKTQLELTRTFIATVEKIEKAKTELATAVAQEKEFKQLVQEAYALQQTSKAHLDSLEQQDSLLRGPIDEAKARIANFNRAQKDWDLKTSLQLKLSELEQQLSGQKEPEPYSGSDPTELATLLGEVQYKIAAVHKTIEAFKNPNVIHCPTCRRSCTVQEAAKIIADAEAELKELTAIQADVSNEHTKAVQEKQQWEHTCTKRAMAIGRLNTLIGATKTQLAGLQDVQMPTANKDDQEAVEFYNDLLAQLSKARAEERENSDMLNSAMIQLTTLNNKVSALHQQIGTADGLIGVTMEEAKAFVADHEQRQRKVGELTGLIHGTEKQLADEQKRLVKLQEETEKAKTLTRFCDYLEFARTALHRDNFPSGKVKAFVDRMLITANMYLDTMQAGFSVSYDKDDGFIAFFPKDSKHMRADRLSGGEQVTFALAFRFAVNDIHTDTGFLVLDEPTVWLDDKHIDYVINALALVKTKLVPRVQLIIVTHDEKLAAVADSVYEVVKR